MTFLNPLVLIGLAAATIPFILHLLNLRKLKTIEFSTLRFLKELQKTKIRKLKLRQLILLILRTAIIILAVMAFARPTIEGSIPGLEKYAKTSAIILIDNSFSMDVSDENGNRFKKAKEIAISILNYLKDGDEVSVVPIAEAGNLNTYSFSTNIESQKVFTNNIRISNSEADILRYITIADNLLESSVNINREIYIISDYQSNIFTTDYQDTIELLSRRSSVYIIPVGFDTKADIVNLSIDTINVLTKIFSLNKPVELEATIRNHSKKNLQGNVLNLYFNNEKISQRSFDIRSNEVKTVSFSVIPTKRGIYSAYLQLESDALESDNRRYFGFTIAAKPKIAVVGLPEKYKYLRFVIENQQNGEGESANEFFKPEEIGGIDFNKFNLVIIASGLLRESDFDRLEQFISTGGASIVFADDVTDLKVLNGVMQKFGITGIIDYEYSRQNPAGFVSIDRIHPVFEGVFKGTTDSKKIIESPKIYKAKPATGGQSIIAISGGNFLAEGRLGLGKLFYIAVSPGDEWSSFPLTGLFPIIIYRGIIYLTSSSIISQYVEPGKDYHISISKRFAQGGNFKIIDPVGTESFKSAALLPAGAVIAFEPFRQFGVYRVLSSVGEPAGIISVNPIPSESMTESLSRKVIIKSIEGLVSDNSIIEFVDNPQNIKQNIKRARIGTELWQIFIIGALLCAIAEMLIERTKKAEIVKQ